MRKLQISLVMVAVAVGCKSKEPPPSAGAPADTPPSAPVAAKPGVPERGPDPADTYARNMSGLRPRQAANCPSALPGTETKIEMTSRGVDVSVTSKDPAVQRHIAALAEFQVRGETAEVARPHDGHHGGNGRMGYCPIIVNAQTTVTATPIAGGVTLHVDARSAARVRELQAQVKQRAQQLPGYLSS